MYMLCTVYQREREQKKQNVQFWTIYPGYSSHHNTKQARRQHHTHVDRAETFSRRPTTAFCLFAWPASAWEGAVAPPMHEENRCLLSSLLNEHVYMFVYGLRYNSSSNNSSRVSGDSPFSLLCREKNVYAHLRPSAYATNRTVSSCRHNIFCHTINSLAPRRESSRREAPHRLFTFYTAEHVGRHNKQ